MQWIINAYLCLVNYFIGNDRHRILTELEIVEKSLTYPSIKKSTTGLTIVNPKTLNRKLTIKRKANGRT